jgi:hypothetical protein
MSCLMTTAGPITCYIRCALLFWLKIETYNYTASGTAVLYMLAAASLCKRHPPIIQLCEYIVKRRHSNACQRLQSSC